MNFVTFILSAGFVALRNVIDLSESQFAPIK